MNKKKLTQMIAKSLAAFLLLGTGCTTTKTEVPVESQAQGHEAHHPEEKAAQENSSRSGMMEKMDMGQMKGMSKQCMAIHKDGKACKHQMMDKCQEKMTMAECKEMMTKANSKEAIK